MCGRYDLNETAARIAAVFRVVRQIPLFEPHPDLRPTDKAPIVRLGKDGQREALLMRWGFAPPFARNRTDRINARGESVRTAYRDAYRNRRCLVPASAFFEWSGDKGSKVKWRITVKDEPLFAFAGLWDWWRDPKRPDAPVEAFTIITTQPNDLLSDIHDRMPVIVAEQDYDEWLTTGSAALLGPLPSEAIEVKRA
ncbi:MAG TPA: SOS response-associated peptidase [Burkholderiaceae bacterium]|nr:SOS response-associated peptidase [Burkholderiaceae bacterium]